LQRVDHITVRPDRIDRDGVPFCEILNNGTPTGRIITGAVLEAALVTDKFYILFLTDDVPFEESLTIHMVRHDFEHMDTAALIRPYGSGALEGLSVADEHNATFLFYDDRTVCLEVLDRWQWRVPFVPELFGVMRPLGFRRHFRLSQGPVA
jgi:hypothetical protein